MTNPNPSPVCPACDGTKVVSQGGHDTGCDACYALSQTLPAPGEVEHPDDRAVDLFAARMKTKLAMAREKGRGGWDDPAQCSVAYLQQLLGEHVAKGDPVDVANFCMMLSHYGATTTLATVAAANDEGVR
jgi:hypothetical protein